MCRHLIERKSKVMDKMIKKIQESQWKSDTWQDEDIPLDFGPNNSGEKEIGEKKRREERDEREASNSLYDLRRSVGRFSSGQELKIICSTKATRRYRKHEISQRIQLKSSGNQGFRVYEVSTGLPRATSTLQEVGLLLLWLYPNLRFVWLCLT